MLDIETIKLAKAIIEVQNFNDYNFYLNLSKEISQIGYIRKYKQFDTKEYDQYIDRINNEKLYYNKVRLITNFAKDIIQNNNIPGLIESILIKIDDLNIILDTADGIVLKYLNERKRSGL